MEPNQKSKPICKFFQLNKCQFGDKCKYSHQAHKQNEPAEKKNVPIQPAKKDLSTYLSGLAESLQQKCSGCKETRFRVYLGCGCKDLCEECAKEGSKCGKGHDYNSEYIV